MEAHPIGLQEFMILWQRFKAGVVTRRGDGDDDGEEEEEDDEEEEEEEEETEDDVRSAFKAYDIDGDGYITKEEMVQVITRMGSVANKEEEASKCIKEMDLDGDGKVSFAEFMVKWRVT